MEREELMGQTVSGIIAYGAYVDEENRDWRQPLPWDPTETGGDDGLEKWWERLQGFVNPHPVPFDDYGNYLPGHNVETAAPYYDAQRDWHEAHPTPWDLEWWGSVYGETTSFFGVRGAPRVRATWEAKPFDPATLVLSPEAEENARSLSDLMAEHGVPLTPMGWHLLALEG
jgi:hypothetical protein